MFSLFHPTPTPPFNQVWKEAVPQVVAVVQATSATPFRVTHTSSFQSFLEDEILLSNSLAAAMAAWMRIWTLMIRLPALEWVAAASPTPSALVWEGLAVTVVLWRNNKTPLWCMSCGWPWKKCCLVAQRKWRFLAKGWILTAERWEERRKSWRCR